MKNIFNFNIFEIWKPMTYRGEKTNYIISNKGRIKSLNYRNRGKEKYMKQFNHKGYRAVNLTINKKFYKALVHRLVAENFIDNPEGLPVVNHKNGKKNRNHVKNLEWCTQADNVKHAKENDLLGDHSGENNQNASVTKKQVKQICKLLEKNKNSISEIADMVGTTRGVVYNIKYGLTWTNISKKYKVDRHDVAEKRKRSKKKKKYAEKMSYDLVYKICEDISETNLSLEEIAEKHGVSYSQVEQLRYKNTWKDVTENFDFSNRDKYKPRKKYGKG